MRSHQFEMNLNCSDNANLMRLRAYIRNRFGKPPLPKKGRQARAHNYRGLTCAPWKR